MTEIQGDKRLAKNTIQMIRITGAQHAQNEKMGAKLKIMSAKLKEQKKGTDVLNKKLAKAQKNAPIKIPHTTMKREEYRRYLIKLLGKEALKGQDVFHIIADSHGGANHPDNFLYALGSPFNRTIGDRHDALNCFLAGQEKALKAVESSVKYGSYSLKLGNSNEEEAKKLHEEGRKVIRSLQRGQRPTMTGLD